MSDISVKFQGLENLTAKISLEKTLRIILPFRTRSFMIRIQQIILQSCVINMVLTRERLKRLVIHILGTRTLTPISYIRVTRKSVVSSSVTPIHC